MGIPSFVASFVAYEVLICFDKLSNLFDGKASDISIRSL
jgi:hypothetical protein